ncbi:MAG: Ig-like domain-containing protein [bacterium]|nr:Ig-like domain-containing protein [bacterium]
MKQIAVIKFCRNYTDYLPHKFMTIKSMARTLVMLFTITSLAALAVSGCSEKDRPKYQNDGPDPAVPVSLVLTPGSGVLAPGEELQLSAQAEYDDGTSQDVTEQARWEVSDAAAAEVDNGLVSALAPGTVTVTASFGEFSARPRSPSPTLLRSA